MPDPFRLKSTYRYGIAASLQSGNFPVETIFDSNERSGKYSGIYETIFYVIIPNFYVQIKTDRERMHKHLYPDQIPGSIPPPIFVITLPLPIMM